MNEMREMAARFYTFLRRANIEPESVRLVLRVADDMVANQLESAIKMDVHPADLYPAGQPLDARLMKVHGITISIASLDRSRV